VQIKLALRSDVERFLGKEALETKLGENGDSYIEILCSELYPITLHYTSATNFLTVVMDYRMKVKSSKGWRYSKPGMSYRVSESNGSH
jgi:hypothetical protein